VAFSFGGPLRFRWKTIRLRRIRQVSDPIRVFIPAWWRHRVALTSSVGFRICSPLRRQGIGRVSADARRATVRCRQQVFGPAAGRVPVQQPPSA
jgi:hypothetical protein